MDILTFLTRDERNMLVAVNGEPAFRGLPDNELLYFVTEDMIHRVLGYNDRADEVVRMKRSVMGELEF